MKTHTILAALLVTALAAACASSGGQSVSAGYSPVPTVSPAPADETILSFDIASKARGTINRYDRTVTLYVPSGTNLAALAPTIALKSGAYTISPLSGVPTDFATPVGHTVTYTVTNGADHWDYAVQVVDTAPSAATVNGWLGRGINLGNDLDAWPGDEGSWTGGVVAHEYFFDDYKALGFDSVRVPITWGAATSPSSRLSNSGGSSTVNADFMDRVDEIAGWGIDRGLAVVINAHHEDWIRTKHGTALTAVLPRFQALWTQIANHFKYWPPQLVFEILNEPHTVEGQPEVTQSDVNSINSAILTIIRSSGGNNATRTVIIGGNSWNAITSLNDQLTVPADSYLIANFHDYNPWEFAGMAGSGSHPTWGSSADIAAMEAELDGAVAWSHGKLPGSVDIPLYMGEFGVTFQFEGKHTDLAQRLNWYTHLAELAAAKGIASAAWDDYGDFKLYDRSGRAFETATLPALIPQD